MKAVVFYLMIVAAFAFPFSGRAAFASSQDEFIAAGIANSATAAVEAPADRLSFPALQIVGGLGLVLSLIVIAYIAAKKFAPQYFSKLPSERNVRVIETLPMGEKRSISLIQVEDRRFLVGNTPHQITLLAPLSDPIPLVSEPEALPAAPRSLMKKERTNPFQNLFEVEKNRSSPYSGKPKVIPEDIRTKMRQLREALER